MSLTLFLCGDVMLGRGVDQVLPHPGEPQLRERYIRDARDYVASAVTNNGPIPVPVDFRYVWGDALVEFERIRRISGSSIWKPVSRPATVTGPERFITECIPGTSRA